MSGPRTTLGEPQLAAASVERAGRRIGIFGGTFDPPHIGHLWLAALAAETVQLDRVLFMPASQPPHKRLRGMTGAADRLLMTRLAIEGEPLFELTAIEMERAGPSYTVDSIAELERHYGEGGRLFLIMAADSLAQIDTWRDPDRLLESTEWVVGPRLGTALPKAAALAERFGAAASRIHLLDGPALDVSSSDIRRRVASGKTIRYLVPRRVEDLIAARGLYRRH
ncbi:MAG: nicotinate-nucleotide adenylyltransferase [Chloroflexota bacterium]